MRFLLFKTRQEEEYRMRKETDLEEVKRIASLFLWLPPHETEFSPVIVKHPFTDCGIVIFHNSQQETETANILESDSALSRWRKEVPTLPQEQLNKAIESGNSREKQSAFFVPKNQYKRGNL